MLDRSRIVGFIFTLLTVGNGSFACLVSLIVFVICVYHLCFTRSKRDDKIIILYCANIYFFVLLYTSMLTVFHTQTILGDLYGISFQSKACIFFGYFLVVISTAIYMASVTQAFYRLSRVVYQQYQWLQRFRFYAILPFIQVLISFLLVSPLFLWKVVTYLPSEAYCFVPYTDFRGILWAVFSIYIVPIGFLSSIYFRITIFIRKERKSQTLIIRRQHQRDALVIRRILITVSLLALAGAPAAFFLVRLIITGEIHPLTYRVAWFAASIAMAGLCVTLVVSIPQLKSIVWKHRADTRRYLLRKEATPETMEMKTNRTS